ncbi:helix-turn-helix domain-containing protein [Halobacillus seohaensis]|uniref:Helix-turn-helix domain-containing protein n=1 Tax=Halobacillus seohaensis TaxID=447421 RepID=A0ABW2EJK4_9BACI
MEIGSRLKEAREAKQLSLDEVQSTTKIQKRYLQAIENNEFSVLPGKFYTRAFIREYSSAVGLDPEQIMQEHENELPSNKEEPIVNYSRVQKSKSDSSSKKGGGFSKVFPTVITIVLIIGLLFVVWYFITQNSNPESNNNMNEEESSQDQVNVTEPSDDEEENQTNSSEEETEPSVDDSDENSREEETGSEESEELEASLEETGTGDFPEHVYEVTGADERELTIEINGESYLAVNAPEGGESLAEGLYTAEDEDIIVDISKFDEVYIRTGSVPGITVKLNGEEIEFPTDNLTQKLSIRFNSL